jgi:hypothetical protein
MSPTSLSYAQARADQGDSLTVPYVGEAQE